MKDKLSKIGDRAEKTQSNIGGEAPDNSTLSPQSEPGPVAGGGDRGGGIGKGHLQPDDSRSLSQSMVEKGRNPGDSGDLTRGQGTNQKGLHPHPHLQTGSGSGRERKDVDGKRAGRADSPPQSEIENRTPTPSASRVGESKGT